MTTENRTRLPAIVDHYIAMSMDKSRNQNEKHIAYLMLVNIVAECNKAISNYERKMK